YRLLETVRQYALEKLSESGEADAVRTRHRDYYTALAAERDADWADSEIDNLSAAFTWSLERNDLDLALLLASALLPLWVRSRITEGINWLNAGLAAADEHGYELPPVVRADALADKAWLETWTGAIGSMRYAEESVAIAREIGDRALLARALTACGCV